MFISVAVTKAYSKQRSISIIEVQIIQIFDGGLPLGDYDCLGAGWEGPCDHLTSSVVRVRENE